MTRTNSKKYIRVECQIGPPPVNRLIGYQLFLSNSSESVIENSLQNCKVLDISLFTNDSIELGGEVLSDPDELKKAYLWIAKWKSEEEYMQNGDIEYYVQAMPLLELKVDGSMNGYVLPVNFEKVDLEKSYISFVAAPLQSSLGKSIVMHFNLELR